jgi:hypothetical protein
MEPLPTFQDVVALMRSAKPPLACRVVELRGKVTERSARVLFDGLEGWFIEDDSRIELRTSEGCVLFDSDGKLERIGPTSTGVHSNGWVKTPIQGHLMNLDDAAGRVIRRDEVDGRQALLVEVDGLRRDEDIAFHLHVDLITGIVVQMSRPDMGVVLCVEDLRVGTTT